MAGTIDQLNFEVILDDKKFTSQVEKDIQLAKKLNASLTTILNAKNKLNAANTASALSQEKIAQAAAKTALAEQKVRTEAEKTALAHQKVKKAIEGAADRLGGGGNSLQRAWLRFSATVWSIVGAIRLFTQTIGSAIKKISDFQQANANLATIMQVSRREIETLTNDALMLGRTTEWTASQVTELQTALAKLGYNIPQIKNMQASVLQFATAVGADLPDAANLAGASLRMFGMYSTEMQKALEILTASTNKTALDFEKLKVALPYVGAIAHSIGFDIADTSALLGVLSNSGLAASRTGTGLRQILLELAKSNGALQTAMGGNIRTFDDFVDGLQRLRDRGLEAGEAQKLVGQRAGAALLILANGVDDIRRLNDEVRDTDELLKKIQADRLDTLHGSTLLLTSAWNGLIQTFRDSAGPMKEIVDWLTKIINKTSLAASRANRVSQGIEGRIHGSDELTKQFRDQFNSLIANDYSPEEATRVVQDAMRKYLNGAMGDNKNPGVEDKWWYKGLTSSPSGLSWITKRATRKSRDAEEQVEAIENTIEAMDDYMTSLSGEKAEIAASEYLEHWKMVFDTQGEAAAREAMSQVADTELIRKMKSSMVAFIENGGSEGAIERGKGAKTADQLQRERISDLQREATYLRKLMDTYAKFKEYLGDEGANAKMVEIFGDGDYSEESIEREVKIITDALRTLGDEGADAAESIENAWGIDAASKALKQLKKDKDAADDAQKSLDKFLESLQDWIDKNQELSGTGAAYNISKALATYKKSLADADKKAKELSKSLIYGTSNPNERLLGFGVINEQWGKDRINALATLRNSISKYADDIFKEQMEGYDLTDWNDKTLSQIKAIREAISKVEIPPEIREMLKDAPDLLKELEDGVNRIKQHTLTNTVDPEMFKKVSKQAKRIAGYVGKAAEKMRELGEAAGNTELAETAELFGMLAQNVQAAADGAEAWGGWWGAIIGGLTDLFDQVTSGITEAIKASNELANTVRDIKDEAWILSQTSLFSSDGIFGENGAARLRGASEAMKNLRADMEALGNPKITRNGMSLWDKISLGWRIVYNSGHIAQEEQMVQGALSDVMAKYGLNVYDKYGNLDPASIRKIIDMFGDEDGVLKRLADDAEAYAEAMKTVEDMMGEVFGDIASSAADNIIDKWIEAGSAALDYADILDDVARKYAKMLIESAILDKVLNQDEADRIADMFINGRADDAMAAIANDMDKLAQMEPVFAQILSAFDPYFLRENESSDSNSLGNGVKSITEDTANLLASYINAIRADVSYIRVMQERGWENLGIVAGGIPSLNEHLAQIAATNFDIAQSSQSILSEMRSVIGAPGTSGMVVRVEAY